MSRNHPKLKVEVKQVAAGRDHSVILLSNGHVLGFGANNEDQLGEKDSWTAIEIGFGESIREIGCGSAFTVGLTSDGTLYGLGSNEDGQLGLGEDTESVKVPEKLLTSVKSFSCGYNHLAVITYEGKVLTAGDNEYGQLGRSTVGYSNKRPLFLTHFWSLALLP